MTFLRRLRRPEALSLAIAAAAAVLVGFAESVARRMRAEENNVEAIMTTVEIALHGARRAAGLEGAGQASPRGSDVAAHLAPLVPLASRLDATQGSARVLEAQRILHQLAQRSADWPRDPPTAERAVPPLREIEALAGQLRQIAAQLDEERERSHRWSVLGLAGALLAAGATCSVVLTRARRRDAALQAELEAGVRARTASLAGEIATRSAVEAELRGARDRLRLALAASNTCCWELDGASLRVDLEPRWSVMRGGGERETRLHLRALLALAHPDDRRRLVERVTACLSGAHDDYAMEHRVRREDGRWMWILSQGRVVTRDSEGLAVRIIGTNTDITGHKAAQEAQQREMAFLSALNETTVDLLQQLSAEQLLQGIVDRTVRLLQVAEVELALFEGEQLIVRARSGAAQPEDDPAAAAGRAALWRRATETRAPAIAGPSPGGDPPAAAFAILHGERCLGVLGLRRQAGETFTSQDIEHGTALSRLAALVLHQSVVFHEALRTAETRTRELAENEARFRGVFHQSPIPILLTSVPDTRIAEANAASLEIFGFAREDVIGRTTEELGIWADATQRAEYFRHLREAGHVRDFEVRMRRHSGAILDMLCSGTVLKLGGQPWVLSSAIDMTARKQAEADRAQLALSLRQAQKMESLGTLAGGIAHDFNNVLTGIFGFTELARLQLEPGHAAEPWLAQVTTTGQRAKDLVRQILTFSRRAEGECRPQRLQPVVEEALRLLRSTLPAMVELERSIASDTAPASVDATQIHQLVMNLCTNAWHALPETGGHIRVALDTCAITMPQTLLIGGLQPGHYVRLAVADNGSGMSPAVVERIFDPFFTTKEAGKGSGLGLAVVHGIMQAHGGAIALKTAPGAGSTFTLYFPALAGAELARPADRAPPRHGRGERILLVDDDPDSGLALERLAQSLGYHVTRFERPMDLLQAFNRAPSACDAVITDLAMPGIPGDVLALELLRLRPALPLIVITGLIDFTRERAMRDAGVVAVMRKPLERHDLAAQLAAVFRADAGGDRTSRPRPSATLL